MSKEKNEQLGMNPSTASAKLLKDILFSLILETNKNYCFHCGIKLTRETFSIEHKVPWLHSENPKELFFNLNNISFSHLECNVKAKRSGGNKLRKSREDNEAWCGKCKSFLDKSEFYSSTTRWNGVKSLCKFHFCEITNNRKKIVRAKI